MNLCQFCNKETENPKFCNNSCAAKLNNVNRTEKRYCKVCNEQLNYTQNFYCSNKCQQKFQWEITKKNISDAGQAPHINTAKRYITERDTHKCSICSITNWQDKPLIMILDHIDGNSENSSLTNLRLVCSNCDSQLPTYKAKNTGNGRHSRRERYSEGKSY